MGSDWAEYQLSDCMDAIIDYRGKTPKKTTQGIPLVTAKIIKNGQIQPITEYIAIDDYDTWMRRGIPLPGDVVLTTEAPLGEVAQLDNRKIALAQRVITLRGKKNVLNNDFLKYLLLSRYVQHQLDGRATGTTVKGIKQSELRQVKLRLPTYNMQIGIAFILKSLDNKITLNNQINQTLEQMAQALFKSWFVDFDPVFDNALAAGNTIPDALQAKAEQRKKILADANTKRLPADIQALFPSEFELTDEMGWVPKGWEVACFSNIADHVKVNKQVEAIKPTDLYVGLEHVDRNNLFLNRAGLGNDVSSNKSEFLGGDVLFGKLRPYFHKVCIAPNDGICSTDILVFRAKATHLRSFMLLTAYSNAFVEYANLRSTGTRMPRASAKDMLQYKIVKPTHNVYECFENQVRAYWQNGQLNTKQTKTLTTLRDTLLPKLISGELKIPEAEQQLQEALAQ